MAATMTMTRMGPESVHEVLGRHMLADGYDMVLDLEKSVGRHLWDARRQRWFLDMFSFFGTLTVGMNHPGLRDEAFQAKLLRAALVNPTNSDIYTTEFAEFVEAFGRVAMRPYLTQAFFVAGGALGVENALKAAMDWKVRRNFRKGATRELGHQIIHFREAFHGRTGYTLSLTNTADPRKYQYFSKFDWPRIVNPAIHFPLDDAELTRLQAVEREAVESIKKAFAERKDDIAAIIIEPIQAEGGDNHFRCEFIRELRRLCDENEALLIFDEVQSGVGLSGKFWAHEHFDVKPDLISFGKKMQVCGMIAGPKLDEEPENVFKVSSRINSTWGGNLVDMVRAQRYLEIIEEEHLVEHAAEVGQHLLTGLQAMAAEEPAVFSNPRGKGLMAAIDFPTPEVRNQVADKAYDLGLVILACGQKSLRFRPPLDVTRTEIDEALDIIRKAAKAIQ